MANDTVFSFGPFLFDLQLRRLTRDGEVVPIDDRHVDLLHLFVSSPMQMLTREELASAGWPDMAIGEHSVEQAVFILGQMLKELSGQPCIESAQPGGYRFIAEVTRAPRRASAEDAVALLDAHEAWVQGRAALETLSVASIARARAVFEGVVERLPDEPVAHVGLANALALQFEMQRMQPNADTALLERAHTHALEATTLAPKYGEGWATLGFVLERIGRVDRAIAAARYSVSLEPRNWRHHLRLAAAGWGSERLAAAEQTLAFVPGLAMAHWLAASVHAARQAFDRADESLATGLRMNQVGTASTARFSAVGLHWLRGLLALARRDATTAAQEFDAELNAVHSGHLYAREMSANTLYSIGGLRFWQGDIGGAQAAFGESIALQPAHPMAHAGLGNYTHANRLAPVEAAIARVVARVARQNQADWATEAASVAAAFAQAAPGRHGWLLSIEPMLNVSAHPDVWSVALEYVRGRAR